jgi:hypothetical protein
VSKPSDVFDQLMQEVWWRIDLSKTRKGHQELIVCADTAVEAMRMARARHGGLVDMVRPFQAERDGHLV